MRKFILVAVIFLTSTAGYAGPPRSLSLATAEAGTTTSVTTEGSRTQTAESPPPPAQPPASQEQASKPATADKTVDAVKMRKHAIPAEAALIYELHRHGFYW